MRHRAVLILLGIANVFETLIGIFILRFALGFLYIPGGMWVVLIVATVLIGSCWFAFYHILINKQKHLWALIPFIVMGILNAIPSVTLIVNGGLSDTLGIGLTSIVLLPTLIYFLGCILLKSNHFEKA